mmetsp:Transcript_3032/g.4669  ORF Transcript_3032/g.4669 Transcript_3032/m.4669 type:complete len:86 (+) Transcript_3032:2961-3218(+)
MGRRYEVCEVLVLEGGSMQWGIVVRLGKLLVMLLRDERRRKRGFLDLIFIEFVEDHPSIVYNDALISNVGGVLVLFDKGPHGYMV